ncbi:MAG: ABC transporter permease [Steroidobacteraceae bacterium]
MKFLPLVAATLLRHKGRTLFTWLSVVTAFMLFSVLAAVRYGMLGKLAISAAERLDTYNLIAQGDPLPLSYYGRIASVPGVTATTYLNGLPGYYQHQENTVVALAFSQTIFDLYPDIKIPARELRTWHGDRQGAVAASALATRFGWKVGDSIPIRSDVPRKDGNTTWYFHLDGIFRTTLPAAYQSFIIHYEYFDDAVADPGLHDVVGEYEERIADPREVTRISNAIDNLFADSSPQTLTQSDEQDALNEVRQFGNVSAIVVYVGIAVFFSLLLIVGNSVVQSVRERDAEFAVLQAMGFPSSWIVRLVLKETLLLLVTGSMVGLALGWVVTRALYPSVGNVLETFQLTWSAAATGILLGIAFGTVAALLPARRIIGLQVAAVLRGA